MTNTFVTLFKTCSVIHICHQFHHMKPYSLLVWTEPFFLGRTEQENKITFLNLRICLGLLVLVISWIIKIWKKVNSKNIYTRLFLRSDLNMQKSQFVLLMTIFYGGIKPISFASNFLFLSQNIVIFPLSVFRFLSSSFMFKNPEKLFHSI